ncbi:type II toxin-antitoxin system RelE/ParE family toxin [Flavobacterium sp. MFBS3-15]|uniref:type II toxin-antitoxin system RelE/ParE family toxin n=1 Tax=Flavobacterium sp. MFBS3-15 TaxID=2989816 RepID=UPI002235F3A1|nr:type II toxin-antitoxin system RelE/ParE family toxin [Flavobacterium sp. MFBS3-15]MCW4470462.1 type II toxin-antitoxin system RelE/ParE family toxin [Flavobacterium sp. MFBS3-15]
MAEIRWTDSALSDIDGIAEFIAEDSEKYAGIQVERFFEETEVLEEFPYSGRIVPELNDKNIREIVLGNYRIIYRIFSEQAVDILSVHHSSRLIINNKRFR